MTDIDIIAAKLAEALEALKPLASLINLIDTEDGDDERFFIHDGSIVLYRHIRTAARLVGYLETEAGKSASADFRSIVDELASLKSNLEDVPLILRQARYLLRDYGAKGGYPGLMPHRLEHIADTIQGFTPRPVPQQAATPEEFRTELALLLLQRHPDFDYDNACLADAQAYGDKMLATVAADV
ncbi:hypothetical protein [Microvirga tunisiensis]|uniref:Uncharacterized protein n=1 Tax=Microvirga tunisiensis TaxID=2108360 RepID=A0A5N7MSG0_9HYPH|nr:hypothetical protein [Microvirga tunisiensis]MPR11935.1 hypothetical protein [Microvirga tunisiensis]MPR29893.1 hypothetical protein [Microvirga tunisiensis]